jgi:hypothetical protein
MQRPIITNENSRATIPPSGKAGFPPPTQIAASDPLKKLDVILDSQVMARADFNEGRGEIFQEYLTCRV